MKRFKQSWRIGSINFHLVEGDLFNVPVDAIVNSEQTNFILSRSETSISGQIWNRYGKSIQDELYSLTSGNVYEPGEVLKTGGGTDYKAIYHAGFHYPWEWLNEIDDDSQTEHIRIIRYCIKEVLEKTKEDGINSVAFPLIGCGEFELDPALLAYEFMIEISQFAELYLYPSIKDVWLVVHRGDLIEAVVNSVVQALIDRNSRLCTYEPLALGVTYLDLFEKTQICSNHPQWSAWMLVRYCELLTGYLFYYLASAVKPAITPRQVIKKDKPATFGLIRIKAKDLAKTINQKELKNEWSRFFIELIQRDIDVGRILERINWDRNNIAHGRVFRSSEKIRLDLLEFICIPEWKKIEEKIGSPGVEGLEPWTREKPAKNINEKLGQGLEIGVLERWGPKNWIYIVPHTGAVFKVEQNI